MRKTKKRALGLPTTNTDNVPAKANQLANFPLNFLRTGRYIYSDGKVQARIIYGYWWLATGGSTTNAYDLGAETNGIYPRYSTTRGHGFALGCVAKNTPTK